MIDLQSHPHPAPHFLCPLSGFALGDCLVLFIVAPALLARHVCPGHQAYNPNMHDIVLLYNVSDCISVRNKCIQDLPFEAILQFHSAYKLFHDSGQSSELNDNVIML